MNIEHISIMQYSLKKKIFYLAFPCFIQEL